MAAFQAEDDEFAALSTEELTDAYRQAGLAMDTARRAALAVGATDDTDRDWSASQDVVVRNAAVRLNKAVDRDVLLRAALIRRHERDREEQSQQRRRDWNAAQGGAESTDAGEDETGYTTRAVFTYTPPPDGPSALRAAGSDTCVFCGGTDTVWQHDLNASKTQWRDEFGYGMTWSDSLALCDACETLWAQSEYWQLLQRQLDSPIEEPDATVEGRLLSIAAFCRADRGPRRQC